MERLKPGLNGISILGLLFTLIVMFALKGDLILERPGIVVEMAIPMALFFAAMFFVVLLVGWRLRFPYRDAVAVAFNATGRDFEIAIAIAITAFSPDGGAGDRGRAAHRGPGDAVPGLVGDAPGAAPVRHERRGSPPRHRGRGVAGSAGTRRG